MTAIGVAYAAFAFVAWVGVLIIAAGFCENRDERALDDRLRRRYRPGRAD